MCGNCSDGGADRQRGGVVSLLGVGKTVRMYKWRFVRRPAERVVRRPLEANSGERVESLRTLEGAGATVWWDPPSEVVFEFAADAVFPVVVVAKTVR